MKIVVRRWLRGSCITFTGSNRRSDGPVRLVTNWPSGRRSSALRPRRHRSSFMSWGLASLTGSSTTLRSASVESRGGSKPPRALTETCPAHVGSLVRPLTSSDGLMGRSRLAMR